MLALPTTNLYRTPPIKIPARQPEFDANDVRPFGRYGAGIYAVHPLGLIAAAAIVCTAWRLPAARSFSIFSLPFGVLIGLLMWLRHRNSAFPSPPSLAGKFPEIPPVTTPHPNRHVPE